MSSFKVDLGTYNKQTPWLGNKDDFLCLFQTAKASNLILPHRDVVRDSQGFVSDLSVIHVELLLFWSLTAPWFPPSRMINISSPLRAIQQKRSLILMHRWCFPPLIMPKHCLSFFSALNDHFFFLFFCINMYQSIKQDIPLISSSS